MAAFLFVGTLLLSVAAAGAPVVDTAPFSSVSLALLFSLSVCVLLETSTLKFVYLITQSERCCALLLPANESTKNIHFLIYDQLARI